MCRGGIISVNLWGHDGLSCCVGAGLSWLIHGNLSILNNAKGHDYIDLMLGWRIVLVN